MFILAWRDIVVRYKQTAIGLAWALLRPILTMVVFVLFRRLANLDAGGAPDAIVVFAAVLPWQFFSSALTESSTSLIGNAGLISKVYFPRLIVPFAAVATAFVDFLVTLGILAVLMLWYGFAPSPTVAALPLFVLLTFGLSFGLGMLLAALNVEFRDFRYVVPFLVQVGLFVSPIAFTTDRIPEPWRAWLVLNPLVGIIDGFRWSIIGDRPPQLTQSLTVSVVVTVVALIVGAWYFRRSERRFADVI